MLDLLTLELLEGIPEFVASLQTYEGGFCNASFPDWSVGLGRSTGMYGPDLAVTRSLTWCFPQPQGIQSRLIPVHPWVKLTEDIRFALRQAGF